MGALEAGRRGGCGRGKSKVPHGGRAVAAKRPALRAKAGSSVASKVGVERPAKVAHVAASSCGITGADGSVKMAGLGSMFI